MELEEVNNTILQTVKQYVHFYLYFEHMDMVSKSLRQSCKITL